MASIRLKAIRLLVADKRSARGRWGGGRQKWKSERWEGDRRKVESRDDLGVGRLELGVGAPIMSTDEGRESRAQRKAFRLKAKGCFGGGIPNGLLYFKPSYLLLLAPV